MAYRDYEVFVYVDYELYSSETRSLYVGANYTPSAHLPSQPSGTTLEAIWVYDYGTGEYTNYTSGSFVASDSGGTIDYYYTSSSGDTYYGGVDYYVDGEYYDGEVDSDSSDEGGVYLSFRAISAPDKEGFTFLGWSTSMGAEYPEYEVGTTITVYATSTSPSSPTTLELYSVYQTATNLYYGKIEYDAGKGSNPPQAQIQSVASLEPDYVSFIITSDEPTSPDGYKFGSWLCTEDGGVYRVGDTLTFMAESTSPENPTTYHLVAQYEAKGSLYLYTNKYAENLFLIGIPYVYNGTTFEMYTSYLDNMGTFTQGVP